MYGEPGGVRTPDPALRRRVLYPTELLTHNAYLEYHLLIILSRRFEEIYIKKEKIALLPKTIIVFSSKLRSLFPSRIGQIRWKW